MKIATKPAQVGGPEEVFYRPATEEVAWFVGMETILPGTVIACADDSTVVDIGFGTVEVEGDCRRGDSVLVCLRPEDLIVLAEGHPPLSRIKNVLEGKVVKAIPSGLALTQHSCH